MVGGELLRCSVGGGRPISLRSLVPFRGSEGAVLDLTKKSPESLVSLVGELCSRRVNSGTAGNSIMSFSSTAVSGKLVRFYGHFSCRSLRPSGVSSGGGCCG